jgi:hypothetical protein
VLSNREPRTELMLVASVRSSPNTCAGPRRPRSAAAGVAIDAVVQGVFARIPAIFGNTFRIEVNRIVDCGSVVVMEGRCKGVVQASGKTLDAQVTHIWDLAGGKLVKFQQYTDTWQFAEVTGETPVITLR